MLPESFSYDEYRDWQVRLAGHESPDDADEKHDQAKLKELETLNQTQNGKRENTLEESI